MRIVLDLQGAQSEGRYRRTGHDTLSLALAVVRNRGEHEVLIALNGLFPDTIEPIRALFDGLLPQENIRVWHAPGPVRACEAGNTWHREIAERIREAFLASLQPDIVHVSSLFEGYSDDVVTSIGVFAPRIPTSVMLHDLIPQMNPEIYLEFPLPNPLPQAGGPLLNPLPLAGEEANVKGACFDLGANESLRELYVNPSYAKHYANQIENLGRAAAWLSISDATSSAVHSIPGFDIGRQVELLDDESAGSNLMSRGPDQTDSPIWDVRAKRAIAVFAEIHASPGGAVGFEGHDALSSRLIESIAAISHRGKHENDLVRIAQAIAISFPGNREKQFFIDVSGVVQEDAKTGIQRVTRSILKEFLDNPPDGYKVEPVYATPNRKGYRYARHYAAHLRNQECDEEDEDIEYRPGDIFMGLDLQHRTLIVQREFLMGLRQDGVKIFFVVYDLLPIFMPHAFVLETDIHKMWLETITAFDGAVCISRAVADELSDWLEGSGQQRIRPFNINWFHLGADIANSVPTFGLPADAGGVLDRIVRAPSFLMVGTVEPRKGHQQTLDAFERLWARGVDINLVIVGKQGWKVDGLVERLRHHQELGKRLFWLKGISDEYLEKVYAASACLVAASEGEGFGLPLIEAARHKLPIIARGIPVFREVAGEHALYFDGLSPDKLAAAVEEWLAVAAAGGVPQSSGMQWLTWVESAEQLKRRICGNDWYKQWLPQKKSAS